MIISYTTYFKRFRENDALTSDWLLILRQPIKIHHFSCFQNKNKNISTRELENRKFKNCEIDYGFRRRKY